MHARWSLHCVARPQSICPLNSCGPLDPLQFVVMRTESPCLEDTPPGSQSVWCACLPLWCTLPHCLQKPCASCIPLSGQESPLPTSWPTWCGRLRHVPLGVSMAASHCGLAGHSLIMQVGHLSIPLGLLEVLFCDMTYQSRAHILLSFCLFLVDLKEFFIFSGRKHFNISRKADQLPLCLDFPEVFL